ncbi:ABC transporter permease [Paenibacillus lemnae]|uniref:ABC transporter permease n=2 Tax=Paenibacillus lemnae TaxID=1330551 RepID=A0A848MDJ3_PAELE|nr:ABC transporter permease [Paenibacillus lemnae]NMO98220.1 ABC transporter permease [Paenibacillus lemnae]
MSVLCFLIAWHVAVVTDVMWPLQFGNLPTPVAVLTEWVELFGQSTYYMDIMISSYRVLLGIILAFFLAVPIGLGMGLSRNASNLFMVNMEMFRPIPLIAYLPIVMLLFSTIESSIIFITFLGAFFPLLISTRDAARRIPVQFVHASRNLGCSRVPSLIRVYLPAMAPEIFTGFSVGIGASWMGVITGEMMSGQTGIGYTTWQAYHLLDYSQSIIGMFTIGLLGSSYSGIIRCVEKVMIRWK